MFGTAGGKGEKRRKKQGKKEEEKEGKNSKIPRAAQPGGMQSNRYASTAPQLLD